MVTTGDLARWVPPLLTTGGSGRAVVTTGDLARSESFVKICASLFSENIYKSQTRRFYSRIASVKGNAPVRPLLSKVTPSRPRIRKKDDV